MVQFNFSLCLSVMWVCLVSHSACVICVSSFSVPHLAVRFQFAGMLHVFAMWSCCGPVVARVPMQYVSNVVMVHDAFFFVVIEV